MRPINIKLLAAVLSCMCYSPVAFPQSYTEEPIPHPLPTAETADLFKGSTNDIHVVGVADSISYIIFDDTYGVKIPYYVRRHENSFAPPVTLPDTGAYHYAPFQATFHLFVHDAAVAGGDSIFIVWSNQQVYATDVPPTFEMRPRIRCVLKTSVNMQNIFDLQGAKNPRVATSPDGYTHWTWESVAPLYPDTNYVVYASSVQYRYRTGLGVLSPPQEIDSGFIPQILIGGNNVVHLLWLMATNSASEYFQLRYCKGSSGVFSAPVTLLENVKASQGGWVPTLPRIAFSVDSSCNVYAGWAEERAYPNSRYFLLKWDGTSVTVDSSDLYLSRFVEFAFRPNGEVHAAWASDELLYSSNVRGPLFSQVRVFQSAQNAGNAHVQLTRNGKPKGIYNDWSANSINYISDLRRGPDSVFYGPSPGFLFTDPYRVTRPVMIDDQNKVWVAYAKGQWNNYTLWLAEFSDNPNSVDGSENYPQSFALFQNYPNPFNPSTTIRYSLPKSSEVSLRIFNLLGEEVETLVSGHRDAGSHVITWDATGWPSGVYFYRLRADGFVETKKLILLK